MHQPDVRRLADEHAASSTLNARGKHQAVSKDGPLVHRPVAIRVFEDDDAADGIELGSGPVRLRHEARHFDRPQPPVGVPVDHDRIVDQRLGGDEFEPVAGRHVERLQGFGWRQRGRFLRDFLNGWRPWPIGGGRLIPESRNGRGDNKDDGRTELEWTHVW